LTIRSKNDLLMDKTIVQQKLVIIQGIIRVFFLFCLFLPLSALAQDGSATLDEGSEEASSKKENSKLASYNEEHSDLASINAKLRELGYEIWESPTKTSELGLAIEEGFAQPYPYQNLMRKFKLGHRGIDIGAVGTLNGGVGTVINAIHRSKITLIGRSVVDSKNFGRPDKRKGTVKRSGSSYPRIITLPGYGKVYPFTRNYGKWRSGVVLVTTIIGGPLDGYTMRYMHMAEIRPDLKIGDIVEAGEHIAVMGGTAVQESGPHLHIDLETPDKIRIDPAPYIGLPPSAISEFAPKRSKKKSASKKSKSKAKSSKSSKTSSKSKKTTRKKRVKVTARKSYESKNPSTDVPETRELERKTSPKKGSKVK